VRLVFHGTLDQHIVPICKAGFSDGRIGSTTDGGWYGKGHYFTPNPEYAVAYTQKKKGVRRLNFWNAIDPGVSVQVLACYAICGKTKILTSQITGAIAEGYDSQSVVVDVKGTPSKEQTPGAGRAEELVLPTGKRALPRFLITITRVNHLILWRDPKINSTENSALAEKLKKEKHIRALTLVHGDCIRLIRHQKKGIQYRIVTSGTEGEDFVDLVRGYYEDVEILVFCMSVDYHKTWAKKYQKVEVTASTQRMLEFCTWADQRKEETPTE